MSTYAYLAISPNAYEGASYEGPGAAEFHYVKIGLTGTVNSGRVRVYNTYNPSGMIASP